MTCVFLTAKIHFIEKYSFDVIVQQYMVTTSTNKMQRGNWRRNEYRDRDNFNNYHRSDNLEFRHENHRGQYRDNFEYRRNRPNYHRKPYDMQPHRSYNSHQSRGKAKHMVSNEEEIIIPLSPLDIKIQNLLNAVQSQGIVGQLVLISSQKDNCTSVLQNAVQSTKDCVLNVALNSNTNKFELTINMNILGETDVSKGKQIAKNELCEMVVEKLKKKCFYIIRKENFEEVSTGEPKREEVPSSSGFEGSKAYNMMLKMGWGGKGLGVQEQGEEKTVADKMVKNITKEGLGTKNVIHEVDQILQNYISSSKVTTLAFDSSFSKEERAQIHNLAQKYNLKSKSQGKEPDRRITITRKLAKWDLVKELLRSNLENDSYKLTIPENYQVMWQDESK